MFFTIESCMSIHYSSALLNQITDCLSSFISDNSIINVNNFILHLYHFRLDIRLINSSCHTDPRQNIAIGNNLSKSWDVAMKPPPSMNNISQECVAVIYRMRCPSDHTEVFIIKK